MLDRLTIERMRALSEGGPIVVALSGGGDSVALLRLLTEEFDDRRLHALIVDHGLREGSAADARRAHSIARGAGVSAQIVGIHWPPGRSRSQQSARELRYAALCAAGRRRGARVISLGHTADDQAETVFMRAAAGSSWRGLAGMSAIAAAPIWPEGRGLSIARPLLRTRREDLRAFLRGRGVEWIEDPANANPAYERVRVRERLRALTQAGFDPTRLTRLAARLREHADAIDAAANGLIAHAAAFEAGAISVARDAWNADGEVRRRALAALVAAASGAEREPSDGAIRRLDASMRSAAFKGATLWGARVAPSPTGFSLERDRGAVEGRADGAAPLAPLLLRAGVETVWDGRLALTPRKGDFVAYADMPEPRLVASDDWRKSEEVTRRWLLADRVAHALLRPSDRINVPKVS